MKNLMNLKNAKVLNKQEQKEVRGGRDYGISYCEYPDGTFAICRPGYICIGEECVRA